MNEEVSLNLIHALRRDAGDESLELAHLIQTRLALDDAAYLAVMSKFFGLPAVGGVELERCAPRFDLIAFADALEKNCLAADADTGLVLILGDPYSPALRIWAQQKLRSVYRTAFAHPEVLKSYLHKLEKGHRAMDGVELQSDAASGAGDVVISLASIALDASPVIKLVNSTLYDALKSKASDIHFESSGAGIHIKYRIDGVLQAVGGGNGAGFAEQVISRIKVLASLDIAERRIPQDGRFQARISGRDVDFRVSIMPSVWGEDAVLRVLDKNGMGKAWQSLGLDLLGLDREVVAHIRHLARAPYGLILVTGPTGSGKSTTLYAALSEIHTGEEKIITIEDPVEYQLQGILQIPVNDKKGLSFARGLRSILRHDPDKILVGEIRDAETAGIAIQAAQTGHLVLASIHANDAFSVMDRFLHMGVEPHGFLDALTGVIAQRLVRVNCPHCTVDDVLPDEPSLADSGLTREETAGWHFRRGAGCISCRKTGFLGRKAIAEVLRINDALRQAFALKLAPAELKELARRQTFVDLRQMALRLVAGGETTLQEINRATFVD
jgi:general secretion pathway protein E